MSEKELRVCQTSHEEIVYLADTRLDHPMDCPLCLCQNKIAELLLAQKKLQDVAAKLRTKIQKLKEAQTGPTGSQGINGTTATDGRKS